MTYKYFKNYVNILRHTVPSTNQEYLLPEVIRLILVTQEYSLAEKKKMAPNNKVGSSTIFCIQLKLYSITEIYSVFHSSCKIFFASQFFIN